MALRTPHSLVVNFLPALLDVVTAAFMVFVLSTYLQLILTMDVTPDKTADSEAMRVRALEAEFVGKLRRDLTTDLASGAIEIEQTLGLVHIRFSDLVLFDSGDHKLKPSGRDLLRRFGQFLASAWQPGVRRVQVEGHTDSDRFVASRRAKYPTNNWELSSARATVVTLFLLDEPFGLPATLFSSNGYADNRPIADNLTDRGKARNRRVEIELMFSGEEQR